MTNLEMIIRKAKTQDIPAIAQIYKSAYSEKPYFENWNYDYLVRKLRRSMKDMKIYVAEADKNVAGFIVFSIYYGYNGKWTYIEDIATSRDFRGRGIGEALMNKAESESRKYKVKGISLNVNINASAMELYNKLGYKKNDMLGMEKKLK